MTSSRRQQLERSLPASCRWLTYRGGEEARQQHHPGPPSGIGDQAMFLSLLAMTPPFDFEHASIEAVKEPSNPFDYDAASDSADGSDSPCPRCDSLLHRRLRASDGAVRIIAACSCLAMSPMSLISPPHGIHWSTVSVEKARRRISQWRARGRSV